MATLLHVHAQRGMSLFAVALLLSGCFGGEPSAADMNGALGRNAEFRQLLMTLVALGQSRIPIRSANQGHEEILKAGVVEKSGCVPAQNAPGYVCDFRWGPKAPDGTVYYGNPIKGRFFKVDGAWYVDRPN